MQKRNLTQRDFSVKNEFVKYSNEFGVIFYIFFNFEAQVRGGTGNSCGSTSCRHQPRT